MRQCWENINPMRDQCSVQTFPVKSGFSRVCVREKERKKNGGRIARRRFNDSTAILCCLYAFTRRVPLQEIQKSRHLAPVRNNSRRVQRATRNFLFLPLRKTTTTRKYFPKNAAILPSKDLLFPRSARDFNIRLASKSSCEKREFRAHSPLR